MPRRNLADSTEKRNLQWTGPFRTCDRCAPTYALNNIENARTCDSIAANSVIPNCAYIREFDEVMATHECSVCVENKVRTNNLWTSCETDVGQFVGCGMLQQAGTQCTECKHDLGYFATGFDATAWQKCTKWEAATSANPLNVVKPN